MGSGRADGVWEDAAGSGGRGGELLDLMREAVDELCWIGWVDRRKWGRWVLGRKRRRTQGTV
ncbi:hypothetical protein ACLOJK_007450 [Asimina triloba]